MKETKGSLLIVDDDKHILEAMAEYLRELGHRTETASTCLEAIDRMKEFPFEVVVCDVNLPDRDGFHLLEWARENAPDTAIIMLTGYGTIESAVEAIRMGAFDYMTKPVIDDELNIAIQRALGQRKIVEENRHLKAQLDQRFGLSNIIGRDYKMLKMYDLIESVADTRTTVLILGESGTGKTMTARSAPVAISPSSRWLAELCPTRFWKASFSGTWPELSRGRVTTKWASFSRPTAGPFSWTRLLRRLPACK